MVRSTGELKVPDGYIASKAYVTFDTFGNNGILRVIVGNKLFSLEPVQGESDRESGMDPVNQDNTIPISLHAQSNTAYICNINVYCEITEEHYNRWQRKVYDLILTNYKALKEEYDNQVAAQAAPLGIKIQGRNTLINRTIERDELKKACLNIFTNQNFSDFGSVVDPPAPPAVGFPEIEVQNARNQGSYIQFFEQAFEWEHMTYLFYPYFWGRKNNWIKIFNLEDTDHLFTRFLQAGSARVVVPVSPEYRSAVLSYLESDRTKIWNGGQQPTIDDPLYKSIVDELKSEQDPTRDATPEGDPWQFVVPTSLVYLESETKLPDFTVPNP